MIFVITSRKGILKMDKKNILITGASSGIGAACALLAAERGCNLAIHYHLNSDGMKLVKKKCTEIGVSVQVLQGDLSDHNDINRIFSTLDNCSFRIDALINNAGIVDKTARLDEMSFERLNRMFGVNLIGPILVAKETVLRMSTRYGGAGGAIVNVSSVAARLGSGNQWVDYAASKAALDIVTKGLSDEVANEGIRVNGVRPGIIDTEIHAKGGAPNRAIESAPLVPIKRAGTAKEVAEAILFLLSDEASYITGTNLDISGGR